jgi:hypothetical protein
MRYSKDFLVDLAKKREDAHKGQKSSRPFSEGYELVGLAGEAQFADEFDMEINTDILPQGDGCIDFRTPAGTVDVKTARKAYNLPREINKPHAEILVFAKYDDATGDVTLLGWEYDREMLKCPITTFGYGTLNHTKHHTKLRPMTELKALCGIEEQKAA